MLSAVAVAIQIENVAQARSPLPFSDNKSFDHIVFAF